MMKLFLLLLFVCFSFQYVSVLVRGNGKFYLEQGKILSGAAYGKYLNSAQKIGWNELWVTATSKYPDPIKAAAVGYLEGALTHAEITFYLENIQDLFLNYLGGNTKILQEVYSFLEVQQNWTMQNVMSQKDDYWTHVGLIQNQLEGMLQGYNDHSNKKLEMIDLVFLNSFPDSLDLMEVVSKESRIDWLNLSTEDAIRKFHERTHCSSLTKITSSGELFSGHSTWIFYSMLNRIFKHISTSFTSVTISATDNSMSSYPGQIASADDFYQLSSRLVVMETSNSIFNYALYVSVIPQTLLSWHRATLANRMATDGSSWFNIFGKHNSGTYNNQWIIVDFQKFHSGMKKDILWIVEQVPSLVMGKDMSESLFSTSYWASYNIPYFREIYNMSGYYEMEQKYGDSFSYEKCPRANIFRRNETMVKDLPSMKNLMRYNNFQHDPLSLGKGDGAICARMDLSPNGSPFGCTDSKVASYPQMILDSVDAICGPTHDQEPFFSWKNWTSWPHAGMPMNFDFIWKTLNSAN